MSKNSQLTKQYDLKNTSLKALRHGIAPELFKLCDFVKDGIDNDEVEVAVINLSLEALQETYLVRRFHRDIVLILHHLSQVLRNGLQKLQCLT